MARRATAGSGGPVLFGRFPLPVLPLYRFTVLPFWRHFLFLNSVSCFRFCRFSHRTVFENNVFCLEGHAKAQDSSKGCSDLYGAIMLVLLYDTTPIHCTPLRLHPPVMNTQRRAVAQGPGDAAGDAGPRPGAERDQLQLGEYSIV